MFLGRGAGDRLQSPEQIYGKKSKFHRKREDENKEKEVNNANIIFYKVYNRNIE
jgi:hypothetical protein